MQAEIPSRPDWFRSVCRAGSPDPAVHRARRSAATPPYSSERTTRPCSGERSELIPNPRSLAGARSYRPAGSPSLAGETRRAMIALWKTFARPPATVWLRRRPRRETCVPAITMASPSLQNQRLVFLENQARRTFLILGKKRPTRPLEPDRWQLEMALASRPSSARCAKPGKRPDCASPSRSAPVAHDCRKGLRGRNALAHVPFSLPAADSRRSPPTSPRAISAFQPGRHRTPADSGDGSRSVVADL